MKAWIYEGGAVIPILPEEHDPDSMGPMYELSDHDGETLVELQQIARHARENLNGFHERLVAKLLKEQG